MDVGWFSLLVFLIQMSDSLTLTLFFLTQRTYTTPVLGPAERSFSSSQDQERSLTEYIQHLETVQQRLGAGRPGRMRPVGSDLKLLSSFTWKPLQYEWFKLRQ